MIVDVTAEMISTGKVGDCWECPVAQALAKKIGISFRVTKLWARCAGSWRMLRLPGAVGIFIKRVDEG